MKQIKHMILLCLFCLTGMAAQAQEKGPASNEIWYTATAKLAEVSGTKTTAGLHYEVFTDADGKTLTMTSHTWEETTGKGVITFGGDIATVGEKAFYRCVDLSSVTIPASVTSIGKQAFRQCSKLATVTFAEGSKLETIGEVAFHGCSLLSSITIPASVTSIGKQAFMQCSKLATVTFAEGSKLETIGEQAFSGCSALSSITISASVTSIGNQAFNQCKELATVTFAEGSKLETIGDVAFNQCSLLSSITIPASVTSIGKQAFNQCKNLATVTFAEGSKLETIGEVAFQSCSALSSVTIPASVTSIGKQAFNLCEKLATVTFAEGSKLETIGESAFQFCSALSSITIPASVTEIGQNAFAYCRNLKSVTVNWTAEDKIVQINSNVFSNCPEGMTLIVPDGTKSLYAAATGWSTYAANMKVYIPVTLRRGLDSMDNYIGYFATFYSSESAYDLTGTNTKAYTGVLETTADPDVDVLKLKDAGNIIGQGIAVVLKYTGEDQGSETIDIVLMPSEETATAGENILTGTDVELSWEDIPENTYALSSSKEYGVGFYKWEGKEIAAHKAYLTLSDPYYAKVFIFQFDGEPTGIKDIQGSMFNVQGSVYNLNGVRVNENYKGIVIKNGKKIYQR